MNIFDERKDVVPEVEKWLLANGYGWRSEVVLKGGRADFVAVHKETGEMLIVEAKAFCTNADKVVTQVTRYGERNHPAAKLAIALPKSESKESLEALCEKRGIQLILLDIAVAKPKYVRPPVEQPVHVFYDGGRWLNAEETKVIQDFRSLDADLQDVVLECARTHSTAPMEALAAARGIDLQLDQEAFKSWNRLA